MWKPATNITKLSILGAVIATTLGIHYGWLTHTIFGHIHWLHAAHGRFCYIPIVIAAAWFGIRGSLAAATVISVAVLPYILSLDVDSNAMLSEYVEIIFYYAIAVLSGALVDRELRARRRAEEARLQLERSQKLSLV
ncbi:MAG: DUF4118 domain-containing protein, partial [candidate division Zixibacteria bacterium]|nr:DUF4118 domain-containing protein [candidate division Zixibacteria bacterium]